MGTFVFGRIALVGAAAASLLGGLCHAQTPAPRARGSQARIGVNMARLRDWDTAWVFVDLFKRARAWIPQVPGDTVPWDTGAALATNANGWPLLAPGQAAATLLTRNLGEHLPGGEYVCLYAGSGSISFGFDAEVTGQAPGRMELFITPSDEGVLCKIESSDPADPIRDIRVVPAEYETTHTSEPFHPLFLERMARYRTVRFMDWQETNGSEQMHWADRSTPQYFSQATERGVALEYALDLCNTLQADAWICVPHLATDAYVSSMAALVRDRLDPNLRVWIEHSNEVWNSIYPQGVYALDQGAALGLSPDPYQAALFYHSRRSVALFDIFEDVFGGTDRLVRVLAAQFDNPWTGEQVMAFEDAWSHADALAVAHYFGRELGTPQQLSSTLDATVPQLLNELLALVEAGREDLEDNQAQAAAHGLELVAYEAGQHMVGVGELVDHAGLAELFHAVNRDPGMEEVFTTALDLWKDAGAGLWCAYNSIGRYDNQGSWGMLERQDQPLDDAPKFRALQEWGDAHSQVVPFGSACGGLMAGALGDPTLGSSGFQLTVGGALPFAPAVLALGKSASSLGSLSLPVGLGPLATGCQLYTSAEFLSITSAGAQGTASVAFEVPASLEYVGYELFAQWASLDALSNPFGAVFSGALTVRLEP